MTTTTKNMLNTSFIQVLTKRKPQQFNSELTLKSLLSYTEDINRTRRQNQKTQLNIFKECNIDIL